MFVFAMLANPSSNLQKPDIQLPEKYKEFSDIFDNGQYIVGAGERTSMGANL